MECRPDLQKLIKNFLKISMRKIGCFLLVLIGIVISVSLPVATIYTINELFFCCIEYNIESYVIASVSIAALCFLILFISDKIYTLKEKHNDDRK